MTEGYDSNSNSVVERRNQKLESITRSLLLNATGGRLYYEELWDTAMDHAQGLCNHMHEVGDKTPAGKAGVDI